MRFLVGGRPTGTIKVTEEGKSLVPSCRWSSTSLLLRNEGGNNRYEDLEEDPDTPVKKCFRSKSFSGRVTHIGGGSYRQVGDIDESKE